MKHSFTALVLVAMTALGGCAVEGTSTDEVIDTQSEDITVSTEVDREDVTTDELIRAMADSNGDSHVDVMAGPQPVPWQESGPQPVPWTPPTPDDDPRGDKAPPESNSLY